MKLTVLALASILLVATLYVDQSDAWRFRRFRIRGRRIFRVLCPFACRTVCKLPGVCSPVCGRLCSGRRKRDLLAQDSKPFPAEFELYDQDQDEHISLNEFAKAIESNERLSSQAFELADANGDGQLNDEEFASAPFLTSNTLNDLEDANFEDEALADME